MVSVCMHTLPRIGCGLLLTAQLSFTVGPLPGEDDWEREEASASKEDTKEGKVAAKNFVFALLKSLFHSD